MKTTKTMNLQRTILLGLAAMTLLGPATVVADPPERGYEFHAFDVPPALETFTSAFGINNRGVIVGNFAAADGDAHGFVFEEGEFIDVAVPGSSFDRGTLNDVNDKGVAVGVFIDAQTEVGHGFVRSPQGEISVLPDAEPDAVSSEPRGINSQGTIVGFYLDADFNGHGYILHDGVSTPFDHPGAVGTSLNGINDRGQILGNWRGADGSPNAFLLQNGVSTPIAVPGAVITRPLGINNRGQIVGEYLGADNVFHGFLFEQGGYRTLDFPGADDTTLTGINDHGVIVGTYNEFSFGLVATPGK